MSEARSQWEYDASRSLPYDDGKLVVTFTGKNLLIEVEQEKAMDSYNELFNCGAGLPLAKARELALWIIDCLDRNVRS